MLHSPSWARLQNLSKHKIYILKEQLKTVTLDEVKLLQGEIKGVEWLDNEMKFFETKLKK